MSAREMQVRQVRCDQCHAKDLVIGHGFPQGWIGLSVNVAGDEPDREFCSAACVAEWRSNYFMEYSLTVAPTVKTDAAP